MTARTGKTLFFQPACQNCPVELTCFFNVQCPIFAKRDEWNDETQPQSLDDRSASGAGTFIMRDKRRTNRETLFFGGRHFPKNCVKTGFFHIFGFRKAGPAKKRLFGAVDGAVDALPDRVSLEVRILFAIITCLHLISFLRR